MVRLAVAWSFAVVVFGVDARRPDAVMGLSGAVEVKTPAEPVASLAVEDAEDGNVVDDASSGNDKVSALTTEDHDANKGPFTKAKNSVQKKLLNAKTKAKLRQAVWKAQLKLDDASLKLETKKVGRDNVENKQKKALEKKEKELSNLEENTREEMEEKEQELMKAKENQATRTEELKTAKKALKKKTGAVEVEPPTELASLAVEDAEDGNDVDDASSGNDKVSALTAGYDDVTTKLQDEKKVAKLRMVVSQAKLNLDEANLIVVTIKLDMHNLQKSGIAALKAKRNELSDLKKDQGVEMKEMNEGVEKAKGNKEERKEELEKAKRALG